MKYLLIVGAVILIGVAWGLLPAVSEAPAGEGALSEYRKRGSSDMAEQVPEDLEYATVGGGCFWCVEAVYERIEGVHSAVSGYAGGHLENPRYEQVVTGDTGHAEVVQIGYDPAKISYEEILKIFWKSHDPTTLNRQGADVGTHYRSIILSHSDEQRRIAEQSKRDAAADFSRPLVTEIVPLELFHQAEDYHQDYFAKNPYAGYCRVVIAPKLDKLGLQSETY